MTPINVPLTILKAKATESKAFEETSQPPKSACFKCGYIASTLPNCCVTLAVEDGKDKNKHPEDNRDMKQNKIVGDAGDCYRAKPHTCQW